MQHNDLYQARLELAKYRLERAKSIFRMQKTAVSESVILMRITVHIILYIMLFPQYLHWMERHISVMALLWLPLTKII